MTSDERLAMTDGFRWRTVDDDTDGQGSLFGVEELINADHSTGRMSDLEFLHVTTRRILNRVPGPSRAPFEWTINAYRGCSHACVFCFARPTHEYLGLNIGEDFDRKIVVKINAVERLRAELADPRWSGDGIAMGTNTDPYQRAEGKYRLTRGIVGVLGEHANPFSILTKSPLVTRDLDLLSLAAGRAAVSVNFSIATLDEAIWRVTEPGSPHPRRRLDAMRRLADAGIATGGLVAPVLPELSDTPEQLRSVTDAIRSAGGSVLGVGALHLRGAVREHFLGWLRTYDEDVWARYLRRYADADHAPARYLDRVRRDAGLPSTVRRS